MTLRGSSEMTAEEVWRQEKKESSGDLWIDKDIEKHEQH